MSAHDVVTGFLVYLSIGSLIWMVLDGLGIIATTYAERRADNTAPALLRGAMVVATVLTILLWPLFVFRMAKGVWSARR